MTITKVPDAQGKLHEVESNKIISRIAVYGVYLNNNSLLMVKDKVSHNWEFPGGGVEKNESYLKTLKREFFEETGLTILDKQLNPNNLIYSCLELFFDININKAWKTKRNFFFISQVTGSLNLKGNKEDIAQAQYFPLNNLPLNQISETTKKVIAHFCDFKKKRNL